MALFSECTRQCAQKELDTADIVREAIYQQRYLLPAAKLKGPLDKLAATPLGHVTGITDRYSARVGGC